MCFFHFGENCEAIREYLENGKTLNFVILFKILGKYKESRKKSMSTTLYFSFGFVSPGRTKCSKGSHSEALNKVNGGCFTGKYHGSLR